MTTITMTDLKRAFSFPFEDEDWQQKFLIGTLISFAGFIIPIIPWIFLYGYGARVMRRIIVDNDLPSLPDWDDLEGLFRDGIKLLGVSLVYFAPFIVLLVIGWGAMMVPSFVVPFLEDTANVAVMLLLIFGGTFGGMFIFWLGMMLMMLLGAIMPAGISHVIATDEFAAAFRIKEWWAIFRANWGGFLISYVLLIGLWMIVMYAFYFLVILCCLLPFVMAPLTFYGMNLMSALFAHAYQEGAVSIAEQTPAVANEVEILS